MSGSRLSSSWISSLNGSSFDADRSRRYVGAVDERNAALIVLRLSPLRRASCLIETPRTKYSRRSSAHCSTQTNPFLPRSTTRPSERHYPLGHLRPRARGGQYWTGGGGSVFTRRRHPSRCRRDTRCGSNTMCSTCAAFQRLVDDGRAALAAGDANAASALLSKALALWRGRPSPTSALTRGSAWPPQDPGKSASTEL